jgi:chitin disaccharide deacetylase
MIVCADDYGLADDIDRAVLDLCALGKLSSVSCMAVLERCSRDAFSALLTHQRNVDIGLHLCLTDAGLHLDTPSTQTLPNFGSLLRRSLFGQTDPRDMSREVQIQYELFIAKSGRQPDYIDGHLHVHQLPGVRQGLLDFVSTLPPHRRPYIRNTFMPAGDLHRAGLPWIKAGIIAAPGATMKKMLGAAAVRTNNGFAGIYDFRKWQKYPEYFPRFVASLRKPNGLLVVHPGLREDWRKQEFETLRRFQLDCSELNRYQ